MRGDVFSMVPFPPFPRRTAMPSLVHAFLFGTPTSCVSIRLLLLSIFCSVLYLLIWHGYLVASNVTTIEYFKVSRHRGDISLRERGEMSP